MHWMLCGVLWGDQRRGLLSLHPQHTQRSVVNASVVDHAVQLVQLRHHVVCCRGQWDEATHQHLHVHAVRTEVHSVELYAVCVESLVAVTEDEAVDLFHQVRHLLSGHANAQWYNLLSRQLLCSHKCGYFTLNRQTVTHLMASLLWQSWQASTRKIKPIWILMKHEMIWWQWHQLDHKQINCTSFQTSPQYLQYFTGWVLFLTPTNSVKVSKYWRHHITLNITATNLTSY